MALANPGQPSSKRSAARAIGGEALFPDELRYYWRVAVKVF